MTKNKQVKLTYRNSNARFLVLTINGVLLLSSILYGNDTSKLLAVVILPFLLYSMYDYLTFNGEQDENRKN